MAGVRTIWASAARSSSSISDANKAIRELVHTFPYHGATSKKKNVVEDVDSGRRLMEKFIKYRDSLKAENKVTSDGSKNTK